MEVKTRFPLGEILVEADVITPKQLDEALEVQKSTKAKIGEILIQLGYTTEEKILFYFAEQQGIPYISLKTQRFETEVLELIPGEMARKYDIIPIDKIGNFITIAMSDPLNDEACAQVEKTTGLRVQRLASTKRDVEKAIERYYSTSLKLPSDNQPSQIIDTGVTPIMANSFSPDGKYLALGSMDGTVILWDVIQREQVAALNGHKWAVLSVAFSPDGKYLASGSMDDTVILWDVIQRKQVAILTGHTSWVCSVSFSPDGKYIASGSDDNTVIIWDAVEKKQVAQLDGHTSRVSSVAFSSDGKWLASGSEDGTVLLQKVNL
jgi:WD40 repeat protein